jgi:SEC-C motif domain protein
MDEKERRDSNDEIQNKMKRPNAQSRGRVTAEELGACPCGAGLFADCCGRFLNSAKSGKIESEAARLPQPQSALELMRSRYTAYTLRDEAYLQASWHSSTRPVGEQLTQDATKWLGLEIIRHAPDGDRAIVEFVARCKIGGRAQRLHESSRFVREDGRWYYVDGVFPEGQ